MGDTEMAPSILGNLTSGSIDSREDRMSSFIGENFSPPPEGARGNPEITRQWILNNVPCFIGPVPVEWTQAVFREASQRNISLFILQTALVMAGRHGYVFASEPVHATKAGDIGSQWQTRKAEFIAVASSANYLNAHQLFHIWEMFWSDKFGQAAKDEERVRKQLHSVNPAVYANNMNLFELGKRDALGPAYQDAVNRLDAAKFMLLATTDLLNWLETRVDVAGDRYTLGQVNEKAIEISKAWGTFETWIMPIILGVLGAAGAIGKSLKRPPSPEPPEPVPANVRPARLKGSRPPVPAGCSGALDFGTKVMRWGNTAAQADARIATLTRGELQRAGVTREMAEAWKDFLTDHVDRISDGTNPNAERARVMQRAVNLLKK